MKPVYHVITSGVTSAAFGYVTQSGPAAIFCFFSGILIDIDHILDFIISKKRVPIRYKELASFCGREKVGKLYMFLHSYEILALYWLAVSTFHLNVVWYGIGAGLTIHVLSDQLTNPVKPLVYFLTYRFKCGFKKKCVFPDDIYEKLI